MQNITSSIIPVTKARDILGNLIEEASSDKFFILTKGGSPQAAIVNYDYLIKLQNAVSKFYQKTYIDSSLLPFTREFSDAEIDEWQKEDVL